MRLSELRRSADPARAHNEENLRQNEVEKAERFLERFAARFDLLLSALEFSSHRSSVEWLKRWIVEPLLCCHIERSKTSLIVTAPAVEGKSQRFFSRHCGIRMTMAFPF
jgi:hypothetical protein